MKKYEVRFYNAKGDLLAICRGNAENAIEAEEKAGWCIIARPYLVDVSRVEVTEA